MHRGAAALLPGLLALAFLSPAASRAPDNDTALPVRFAEGSLHGFLELRTAAGAYLASGDLLQRLRDTTLESVMQFRFTDSSFFEETVEFTQRRVFSLLRYRLVQRGPAFPRDLDASLARDGTYRVVARERDGKEKRYEGRVDPQPDLYNGMVIVATKNLPPGQGRRVHLVAFTPQPRLIGLELVPDGHSEVKLGERSSRAAHYLFKPKLNLVLRVGAALTGQTPPDSHVWIHREEVPAFLRFQGPLYSGPEWRIDLMGPSWPGNSR